MPRNVNTNDIPCPMCGENIEIEYDRGSLHSVLGGCPHALDWTENKMDKKRKYEFDKEIWQWIEEYWAWRANESRAGKYGW